MNEIVTRKTPFEEVKWETECDRMIRQGKRPETIIFDKKYDQLRDKCWEQDPNKRPSFKQIDEILKEML